MIGLDTNVLIRYFVEDDPVQTRQAIRFIETRCNRAMPGFVDRVALCELVWVLSSGHGYRRSDIAEVIEELLASPELVLEDHDLVRATLNIFRNTGVDFADVLIGQVNRARGCKATATFDRKAARLDGFMRVT